MTAAPLQLLEGLDSWKSQELDRIEPGVFEAAGFEEEEPRLGADEGGGDYDMGEEDPQDTRMSRYCVWLSYSRHKIVLCLYVCTSVRRAHAPPLIWTLRNGDISNDLSDANTRWGFDCLPRD